MTFFCTSLIAFCIWCAVDLLEQLLSPRALREGLPSAQQMLQHEFFQGLNVEETQSRQIFKLPAQVKEIMKLVASKIEERLRHDQKIVSMSLNILNARDK